MTACIAQAKDSGPGRDVRQVRGAAQTLIPNANIANVVVDHSTGRALVQWSRADGTRGIDGFAYVYDRWWNLLHLHTAGRRWCGSGSPPFSNGILSLNQPIGIGDLIDAGVPRTLAAEAVVDFDGFNNRSVQFAQGIRNLSFPECANAAPETTPGPALRPSPADSDGYAVSILMPPGSQALAPAKIIARRPNSVENWTYYPGGNAYVYFNLVTDAGTPVDVPAGTTVDIWCPFVLDTNKTYSLTLAKAAESVGPINGKLRGNILHFELPAFTIPAHTTLAGEVDGTL